MSREGTLAALLILLVLFGCAPIAAAPSARDLPATDRMHDGGGDGGGDGGDSM